MNIIEKINLVFCHRFYANANRHICFYANAQNPTKEKQKSLFPLASLRVVSLIVIILVTSCSPQSKESYIEDYKEFISKVHKESKNYTEQDWKKADEKYNKYTGEWHEKFEDEFTWKEDIILTKLQFQYNLTKLKANSTDFFNSFIKEDYDQLKEQIKYYSENEMNEDIEYILEQAKEFGESASKTVEEILEELDIELEELKK